MNRRTAVALILSLAVTVTVADPTQARQTPTPVVPDGFGAAKLGMSAAQVRALYPALAPAPALKNVPYFNNPKLTRYVLMQHAVDGLKEPVDIEFRFWDDHLWSVIVYTGNNPFDAVLAQLASRYGPSSTHTGAPSWVGPRSSLVTTPAQKWYSVNDLVLSREAQHDLTERLRQQHRALPDGTAPRTGGAAPGAPSTTPE